MPFNGDIGKQLLLSMPIMPIYLLVVFMNGLYAAFTFSKTLQIHASFKAVEESKPASDNKSALLCIALRFLHFYSETCFSKQEALVSCQH